MSKTRSNALELAQAGVIAALYVVLTLVFAPISFGSVQLRVAEALTILPLFTSAAVPGLFVGCLVANIFGGAVLGVLFVRKAPQRFFEIVIEIIVIVSAVKLLWPSHTVNTPEPAAGSEPAEASAPAELPPPGPETAGAG